MSYESTNSRYRSYRTPVKATGRPERQKTNLEKRMERLISENANSRQATRQEGEVKTLVFIKKSATVHQNVEQDKIFLTIRAMAMSNIKSIESIVMNMDFADPYEKEMRIVGKVNELDKFRKHLELSFEKFNEIIDCRMEA